MIRREKTQNVIMAVVIVLGLISAASLVSSSNYYSASYLIGRYLEADLVGITVRNLDPENQTINPSISVKFNLKTPDVENGDATLTFLRASVYLNGESFNYIIFSKKPSGEAAKLGPNYDRNFSLGGSVIQEPDQQLLYDAYANSNWTFVIIFIMSYRVLNSEAVTRRTASFSQNGVNLVESSELSLTTQNILQQGDLRNSHWIYSTDVS